jgi:O-antigen/teichoic acid export membrane protein
VAIASLARIILAISISLILIILFEKGAMGRIIGLLVGNIAIFTIAIYDIVKYTKFKFSINTLIQTLVLGLPLIFSVFSYVIMESSDKYMLERMVGLHELGIYDIAYTYSAIPLFLLVGFSQVWQPVFFENMKKGADKILLKLSSYYIVFFFLISLSVIVFSNEVFNFFIDVKYISAIKIIPWIVLGIFFLGLSNLIASIYSYQKKFKEIGIIAIIAAIINVVLNYFFIKSYGLVGAAIASALTYSLYFLILLFKIRKDFTQVFSLKFFSLTLSILLITAIIFNYVNSSYLEFNLLIFFAKALAFIFVLVFLLFFGLIDYKDKLVIKRFLKDRWSLRKNY